MRVLSPRSWIEADGVATAAARALIVDCVPTEQQNMANAWAGRMIGVGNVLGYLRSTTAFLPTNAVVAT
jgi:hypothetical protein